MPYWSIGEWRARIGSSWWALGRPFKTRSPFRGKKQRALPLSQGVTMMLLLIMSIGVNLGLRALVARGHHLPLLRIFEGGTIPDRTYLINLGLILTMVLQISSALVYQLLSMVTRSSKGFIGGLIESLSFRTCFLYYSIFLILKMVNPSMLPVHWLTLLVVQTADCLLPLSVLWKTVANKQDLVEKLNYFEADVEVVIMIRREGTWVLAVAKAVLDVVLSVAASVILSLLLISGDVERNPGPLGDINYDTIDTTQVLKKHLPELMNALWAIQSSYYSFGRSLNLEIADLRTIRDRYPDKSDTELALEDVLLLWLDQKYNVAVHGPPTWQMVVKAVDEMCGGSYRDLAKEIASNHQAVATVGAKRQRPVSSEESTCSSIEIVATAGAKRQRLISSEESTSSSTETGPSRIRVRINDSEEPFTFEESGGNNHKLAKQIHPTAHVAAEGTSGASVSITQKEDKDVTTLLTSTPEFMCAADAGGSEVVNVCRGSKGAIDGTQAQRTTGESAPETAAAGTCTSGAEVASISNVGIKENKDDLLDSSKFREVLDEVWDHRARWKFIGVEWGINAGTLAAIEVDHKTVDDCIFKLIQIWLNQPQDSPRPTRSAIKAALQSRRVLVADVTTDNQREDYVAYIKSVYKTMTYCSFLQGDQWPPSVADCMKVCNLAMIKAQQVQRKQTEDNYKFMRMTITGKVDGILEAKVPVELKDIFKQIEEGKTRKVLLEGAPGCGKSTLSFHICQQWSNGNLFQEYRLVILVRLRERAVQNSNNITDLMPRRNKSHQLFEELTASNGNGGKDGNHTLFILDGWDELPTDVPGRSIIIQLLHSTSFDVIITSRSISSMSLYELKVLNTRIEILGFTKGELKLYFASCLDNDVTKIEKLQQSIQKNPAVAGTCYLPLNASILVHLFKYHDHELPETQFEIFSALIRNCIVRHMRKCENDKVEGIKSLDKLPLVIRDKFTKICKVAYEGVMRDEIIFESEDLDSDFNTLGLLQGVESLIDAGRARSYNFLHLSIQELLAAIHMASQLEPSEQVAQFRQLFGQARFAAVFQFYTAKTKLKTPGIQEVVVEAVKKSLANRKITEFTPQDTASAQNRFDSKHVKPQLLILSLLHCLYEAQDKALCELVVHQFKDLTLDLGGIRLNPADCLAVGYFLTHCKLFKVNLSSCPIGDDGCKTMFREGVAYDLRILYLFGNSIGDEGAKVLSDAIKTMGNLQMLNLGGNSIGDEGAKVLSEAIKTMGNLQQLSLGANSIGDEGAKVLSEAIKTMGNLRRLYLYTNSIGDEGAKLLSEAIKTMSNLQLLDLEHNAIGDVGREALKEAAKEKGTYISGLAADDQK